MILDKVISLCCANDATIDVLKKFGRKQEETPEVTEAPKPVQQSRKLAKKFTDKDAKYDSVMFAKLPLKVRKAAQVLGFTEETWNNNGWPKSEDKWWESLTADECQAAETLGWDQTAWDTQYEDKNFDDLPGVVQKAALAGGFTKETWDDDEWPHDLHKDWNDLTDAQRRAMNVLGYDKWQWE